MGGAAPSRVSPNKNLHAIHVFPERQQWATVHASPADGELQLAMFNYL